MRRHPLMRLALLTSVGAVAACSLIVDFDPEGQPCDSNQACLPAYHCENGECVSGAPPDAGSRLTLDQFCGDLIPALADFLESCEAAQSSAGWAALATASFEALGVEPCQAERAAIRDLRASYETSRAAPCLQAIRTTPCTKTARSTLVQLFRAEALVSSFAQIFPACEGVVVGSVQRGGQCFASVECSPADYCLNNDSCPGTCEAKKASGEIAPTVPDRDACQAGLYPYSANGVLRCLPFVEPGTRCDPAVDGGPNQLCAFGSTCVFPQNVCVLESGLSEPCADPAGTECTAFLQCRSGSCQRLASANETCQSGGAQCKIDLSCDVPDQDAGICAAPRPAGQPCWFERLCEPGLRCVGADFSVTPPVQGACAVKLPEGSACSSDNDCEAHLFCTATAPQTCQVRKDLGVSCANFNECRPGLRCTGGVCAARRCSDPAP